MKRKGMWTGHASTILLLGYWIKSFKNLKGTVALSFCLADIYLTHRSICWTSRSSPLKFLIVWKIYWKNDIKIFHFQNLLQSEFLLTLLPLQDLYHGQYSSCWSLLPSCFLTVAFSSGTHWINIEKWLDMI